MKAITTSYISFALLLASCSGKAEVSAPEEKVVAESQSVQLSTAQMNNSGITTGFPEQREMHLSLKVNGLVDVPPGNQVSVSVPLGGYLKMSALIPGAKVRKGSVLAILEDQQYIQLQQDYLTAKNSLHFLELDYKRQKDLNETKTTSDKVMQQVQNEYTGQKILVRALAEKLRMIGIVPERLTENSISRSISVLSPIDGYVTKVNANTGRYVNPTDVLFELINPAALQLQLTVFENDAANLAVGQKIICTVNGNADVKYTATIDLISPHIGEDRSAEVHGHFDAGAKGLMPGTFVNAEIGINNAKVTAVPEDAVVKWENKHYVFMEEKPGSYLLHPVETGTTSEGFTEIRSTLPAGKVVLKNAYTLLMKMKNSEE